MELIYQVKYNGRLVDSDKFRVVMHHADGMSQVAEGWEHYQRLLKTGEWFERKSDIPEKKPIQRKYKRRAVNDDNCT